MSDSNEVVSVAQVCSPCIKVCVLDAGGVCTGCGRHIDEIAHWGQLTPQQQRSICELAAQRLANRESAAADPNYGKP